MEGTNGINLDAYDRVLEEWNKFVNRVEGMECFQQSNYNYYLIVAKTLDVNKQREENLFGFIMDILYLLLTGNSKLTMLSSKRLVEKLNVVLGRDIDDELTLKSIAQRIYDYTIKQVREHNTVGVDYVWYQDFIRLSCYLKDYYFIKLNEPEKPLCFKVRYEFEIEGQTHKGVETEASWYYLDQRGKFYYNAPFKPIVECDMDIYKELTPLIKINNEYLSIEEIERRIK